jgi:uncharacterized metal-binding protein YceD (DUF177 family)
MLKFYIREIPEGQSSKTVQLEPEDLDLSPYEFKGGSVDFEFERALHFIEVQFTAHADVELVCDRSLRPYIHHIDAEYKIVFKVDVREETETEEAAIRRFNFDTNTFSVADEVRDTIMLHIPIKKVHPDYVDDDGSLEEFETKKYGEPDIPEEPDEPVDPRFEKLKKLKDSDTEEE